MKCVPMEKNNEQDTYQHSPLGQKYCAELPRILRMSDSDLEGALAALDYYLEQNPPPAFQNTLLTWKGTFYLEHGRYDDAVRELRAADALRIRDDLQNFNTKYTLAKALDLGGNAEDAYTVLAKALDEIEEPSLQIDLLPALAWFSSSLGRALPERAMHALGRGKQFYGIGDQDALSDMFAEITRVKDLKHEASVSYSALILAIRRTESAGEKMALIEAYIQGAKVPYYKRLAEGLLGQERD